MLVYRGGEKTSFADRPDPATIQPMTIQDITSELIEHLQKSRIPQGSDLADLGNEIGILVGKYTQGDDLDSFIAGIRHGVSLTDGTH